MYDLLAVLRVSLYYLDKMKKLSVISPVYNEQRTIRQLLEAVEAIQLPDMEKEIILVDDCSTDGTRPLLQKLAASLSLLDACHGLSFVPVIAYPRGRVDSRVRQKVKEAGFIGGLRIWAAGMHKMIIL